MKRTNYWLLLSAAIVVPAVPLGAQEPAAVSGAWSPLKASATLTKPTSNERAPVTLVAVPPAPSHFSGTFATTAEGDGEAQRIVELGAEEDRQTSPEIVVSSVAGIGALELDAPIRRLATVRLDNREHDPDVRTGVHVLTTEFDEFVTSVTVGQILSSDTARFPGCTVQRGAGRSSSLVAAPTRYVPDDMQIVLSDASGRSYFDGAVPARVELLVSEVPAIAATTDSEESWISDDVTSGVDQASNRAAVRADRREERQAERREERQARRRDKSSELSQDGAWIKLKGRGFRQFGKILLPPAPALNLRAGDGTTESLDDILTDSESMVLEWDRATTSAESDVLIELSLVRSSTEQVAEDAMRMICLMPDTGAFEPPDAVWEAIDLNNYQATRIEVSRRTEQTQRLRRSLVRIVRRSIHVIASK